MLKVIRFFVPALMLVACVHSAGAIKLVPDEASRIELGTSGVFAQKDNYGNYHIIYDARYSVKAIEGAVELFKTHHPHTALYIRQSPAIGLPFEQMKALGFEFAEFDRETSQVLWILDNGRGVSQIGNSITGAGVIVRRPTGEILFILNPDNKTWVFPSGGTDRGEFIRQGAVRELKEEVGITASVEQLRLIMISNYMNALGRKDLNGFNSFFLLDNYTGNASTSVEAPELAWIHPHELAGKTQYKGRNLHKLLSYILDALKEKTQHSQQVKALDNSVDVTIVR